MLSIAGNVYALLLNLGYRNGPKKVISETLSGVRAEIHLLDTFLEENAVMQCSAWDRYTKGPFENKDLSTHASLT